jgi:hypothetical protein
MPALRPLVLALSFVTSLTAQYQYYVPELVDGNAPASGSGSHPVNIRTTFVLVNTGSTKANIAIAATRAALLPGILIYPAWAAAATSPPRSRRAPRASS